MSLEWQFMKNCIQGEVWTRKIRYWANLLHMKVKRWPRKVSTMMLEEQFRSDWYKELAEAREEMEVSFETVMEKRYKRRIRSKWDQWEKKQ